MTHPLAIVWRVPLGGYRAHAVPSQAEAYDPARGTEREAICGARVRGDRKPKRAKRCSRCAVLASTRTPALRDRLELRLEELRAETTATGTTERKAS